MEHLTRRILTAAILAGPILFVTNVAAPVLAAQPPNVVLIISDDQAWTDFGFMGHPAIRTPHLDGLARQSALFRHGYVPTSLCRPSLATLLSGLYPHQHKITGNDPRDRSQRAVMLKHIDRIPKLPVLLAQKGYVSYQSGKWWEGNYRLGGFTAGMTHGDPKKGGRHGDEGLAIGRHGLKPVFDFIDASREKPFFVWYAPMMPHAPHTPPQRLLEHYAIDGRPIEVARYYAMCEWFDETCGQLLEHLDRRGLTDNTLVVFVTDNGWITRTPQTPVEPGWKESFAPRSKRSPYDAGIRTPIMLRLPGRVRTGDYSALAGSIDIAPTILHLAGVPVPAELPGINLAQVANAGGNTERTALFGEIFEHDVADLDNPAAGLRYRWCIAGRMKLIVPVESSGKPELYDLAGDPHETHNLAADQPNTVQTMIRQMDAWWAAERPRP